MMTMKNKPEGKQKTECWRECECRLCDIGAHERCNSAKCHMPKWKDMGRPKKPKKSI